MTSNRPSIEQQITFLYALDLAETAHFYEQVMGLSLKLDQGSCRIYQVGADSFLGFCQRSEVEEGLSEPEARHLILTLVTQEVDEWYQHLSGKGVIFEVPPATNPRYNIYHCFLRDPNGYLIEIQRFLHPF